MSEFTDTLTGRVDLMRLTADLLSKTAAAASLSATRQPQEACRLAVEVDGCTVAAGLVSVAGSTDETFSFTANGVVVGIKDFSSISGITIAGISDGFVNIRSVSKTGQPVNQEITIYSSLAVRFYPLSGKIRMMAAGQEKASLYKMMAAPDKVIKENDIMRAVSGIPGITYGQVSFVEEVIDFDGLTHHMEAEITPL